MPRRWLQRQQVDGMAHDPGLYQLEAVNGRDFFISGSYGVRDPLKQGPVCSDSALARSHGMLSQQS